MFGTIRKHQTWLWVVIISLTIVSFVVFFSPYQRMQDGSGPRNYGSIDGKQVSEEQYLRAAKEVNLRYFFMSGGQWPDADAERQGWSEMREAYQWMFLTRKQEELGIYVGPDVVADVARQMLRSFERGGVSGAQAFRTQVLQPRGLSMEDFERFVRHFVGLQELISVAGVSGKLVTPAEIRALYIRENQEVATSAVVFEATNFLSQVNVTPEAVAQFYSNRLGSYRIPERVQVRYVAFPFTNFYGSADQELGNITNLNQRVDMIYAQNTNLFADAKSPQEAKQRIREQMRKEIAQLSARRKANEFAVTLFDKEPQKPENLEALAKEHGYKVQVSPPVDRSGAPEGMNVGAPFVNAAMRLSPTNEPFAGPVLGDDAVYVMTFHKRIPSEVPSLDSIRQRVTNDYKQMQAVALARQAGFTFAQSVSNSVAQGKRFAEAAKAANQKVVDLPPFSLRTQDLPNLDEQISINQLKQLAFGTSAGNVSPFAPTLDGGMVVYVKERLPINEARLKEELPAFSQYVRQTRQNEAFNDWFRRQAERALRDTPLNAPQPTTPNLQPGQAPAPAPAKAS